MFQGTILCVPRSEAIRHAENYLSEMGLHTTRTPAPDISHVLLPVPSFPSGDEYLAHMMAELPERVIFSGGNLTSLLLKGHTVLDFLQDPYYLAGNAAITAACALKLVKEKSGNTLDGCPVLVTGWGRIGKCLCRLLDKEGAILTVAVRKDADRAMIRALDWRSISIEDAAEEAARYDVIINTVPAMVLPEISAKENAILLELASTPGMSGGNIIDGRRLPARLAPDASGKLIANTFVRLALREDRIS